MNKKQVSAGAIVLNKDQKVLIVFQNKNKYWEFPKGKQEKGETVWQTLKRELEEETGIKKFVRLKKFKAVVKYKFKFKKDFISKEVIYFLLQTKEEVKLSHEHKAFKWVTPRGAKRFFKHKNQKELVDKLIEYLK